MLWFYFSLLAVCIYAIVNTIDKNVISNYFKKPYPQMVIAGIVQFIIGLIAITIFGIGPITYPTITLAILSGFAAFFGGFLYFFAISKEEVSRVIPMLNFIPVWSIIIAVIFLGETLPIIKIFGITLMILGAFIISYKLGTKFALSKGLALMLVSTIFYSSVFILWSLSSTIMQYWTVFFFSGTGFFIGSIILFVFKKEYIIKNLKKSKNATLFSISAETLSAFGDILMILAFSIGLVSLTSVIGTFQPAILLGFVIILSLFKPKILKEEFTKLTLLLKIIAVSLIVIGSILIL